MVGGGDDVDCWVGEFLLLSNGMCLFREDDESETNVQQPESEEGNGWADHGKD